MSLEAENLTAELDVLAGESLPHRPLDLERACREGLRIRRRRQGLAVLGCAAGLAAVAALGVGVLPQLGAGTPSAAAGRTTSRYTPPPAVAKPAAGAPLTSLVRIGWLPASARTVVSGIDGTLSGPLDASTGTDKNDGGSHVAVTGYDHGPRPQAGGSLHQVPAADVKGQPAYWVTTQPGQPVVDGSATLVWRDASGLWLSVDVSGLAGDEPVEATAVHIASTVRVGTIPVRLPIRLSAAPAGTTVDQAVLGTAAHGSQGVINLNMIVSYAGESFNIFVGPAGLPQGPWPGTTSFCETAHGLNICVDGTPKPGDGIPEELLSRIVPLGDNPAQWSADFLPR